MQLKVASTHLLIPESGPAGVKPALLTHTIIQSSTTLNLFIQPII